MSSAIDVGAAKTFVQLNARLIDRHRFAYLFEGGGAEPVLAALAAYQNPDGGYGHALDADFRGAESQPAFVYTALRILDEVDACRGEVTTRIVDFLASVTAADGGVPILLPSVRQSPSPPWWNLDGMSPDGSLLPTAGIAGILHKNGVMHPWLDAATAFCWRALDALDQTHPYEVESCVLFVDHVPDRPRAERAASRLGELVRNRKMVALERRTGAGAQISPGYADREWHAPLEYATEPTSLARRWFSDEEIERDLDALAESQEDDGGWSFNWRQWNPATTIEWRGAVTVEALQRLRAYGRLL
jgi:hypothetical protein